VPSKAFLTAANIAHTVKNSSDFGIFIKGEVQVRLCQSNGKNEKNKSRDSENDSVERFHKFMGVDVFLGEAKFVGKNQVEVNG